MNDINLSNETIRKLATEIAKRFFQYCEKLLIVGEEAGLLGLLMKDHLEEIEKKRAKDQALKALGVTISKLPVKRNPFYMEQIDDFWKQIDDENKKQGKGTL